MTRRRRRALAVMTGLALVAASAAVAALVADGDDDHEAVRLRSGAGATPTEPTSTTLELVAETTSTTVATSTTGAPAPSTTARPKPPPTTAGATTTTTPSLVLRASAPVCESVTPAPSPPGTELLVLAPAPFVGGLHERPVDGDVDRTIPGTAGYLDGAAVSPDGRWLATAVIDDAHRTSSGAAPRNLVVHDLLSGCRTQLSDQTVDFHTQPTWTADSRRVGFLWVPGGNMGDRSAHRAAVVDRTGGTASILAPSFEAPVWAPDGSGRFAVTVQNGIEVRHADGKPPTMIPVQGGAEYLEWSKDGSRLVFTLSVRQGVWVADADGSSEPRSLTTVEGGRVSIYWSAWSPDGSKLAYVRGCCPNEQGRQQYDLWVVDADGSDARQLTTSHRVQSSRPIWSPSGTSIAYLDTEVPPNPLTVMVVDVAPEGATPRVLVRGAGLLAWLRRT